MRTTLFAFMIATTLTSGTAFAQMDMPQDAANSVPTLSGGVGTSDRAEIEAQQHNYHLKLVFSGQGGAFLSGVNVTLADKAGKTVAAAITDGPILLMSPPAGTYKLTATAQGIVKTMNVVVGAGLKTYQIGFPIHDDAELTDGAGIYLPKATSTMDMGTDAPAPATR